MVSKLDAAAWQDTVEENYRELFDYAVRFLGNPHDAEDATQETFLRAYRTWSGPQVETRKWLFRIARNVCIDNRRRLKRWLSSLYRDPDACSPPPTQPADPSFMILAHLARLPERQREVFILRHWHDFSTDETASVLGLSAGTVKSHLSRAVKQLQKSLAGTTDSSGRTLHKVKAKL